MSTDMSSPEMGGAADSHHATGQSTSASGWYPDPNDNTLLRWWDGTSWTDAVRQDDTAGSPAARPATRRRIALAGLAVAGLVGIAAVGATVLRSDSVTVDFSIEVDKLCSDSSYGYADFYDGTVVTVESGSGEVLGMAPLDDSPTGTNCTYSAAFEVDQSPDGIYRVTAGNENRGYLTYDDADIEDGVLTVSANLD